MAATTSRSTSAEPVHPKSTVFYPPGKLCGDKQGNYISKIQENCIRTCPYSSKAETIHHKYSFSTLGASLRT